MAEKWTVRRLLVDGIVGGIVVGVFKWIWKLAEDAGLQLVNNRIGEFVGPMLAPYTSFLFAWAPPVAAAIAVFMAYHFVNKHWVSKPAESHDSLDNTIEFEWEPAPSEFVVPQDGKFYQMVLSPIPVEVLSGGPGTSITTPGTTIKLLQGSYRCRVINYSDVAIFNAQFEIPTVFWEAVLNPKPSAVVTGAGPITVKGQGKEIVSRPWLITMPRVEANPATPFVFYLSNPNDVFIRATAPDTITFRRLGRGAPETARLIAPHRPMLVFNPPMGDLMPSPARAPAMAGIGDDPIARALLRPGWILNFNPTHPKGRKAISFMDDGSIGEGRNANEYVWKVSNNRLVITRANGTIQNRFRYDADKDRFTCTNDFDAVGVKDQTIERA